MSEDPVTRRSETEGSSYTTEFYSAVRSAGRHSAPVVVPLLMDLIGPRSVVDVGCGVGSWLAVFEQHGVKDFIGIDASSVDPAMLEIPKDCFVAQDLRQPVYLGRRFELVVSLEVAEHLPEESSEGFVETLTSLGPVVTFSAAIPSQGGVNHVNEQWQSYWAEKFARRGYLPVDCIRRRVWENDNVEWWYSQNTLVYVEETSLDSYPALKKEYELMGVSQLSIVHPKKYLYLLEWAMDHYDGT